MTGSRARLPVAFVPARCSGPSGCRGERGGAPLAPPFRRGVQGGPDSRALPQEERQAVRRID